MLRALASEVRVAILKLLHVEGPMNVNDIADKLGLPQSTVSTNMQILEERGPDPHRDAEGAQGQPEDLPLDCSTKCW